MIESIEFTNFKALRKTVLPLSPFTLLLGPNGSGKTSILQALRAIAFAFSGKAQDITWASVISVMAKHSPDVVTVELRLGLNGRQHVSNRWLQGGDFAANMSGVEQSEEKQVHEWLSRMQVFSLEPSVIAKPIAVSSGPLQSNGSGLAAVLDDLKDNYPERWESLLAELRRWLPEYDYILFDKPETGQKGIVLRTKSGGYRIPASELSHGTLVAITLLTLAYMPNPPSLIGLDEIDRGLHPRLLRHLQDALYRLAYPESCGEKRPPIQVIATTHSPYLLDLYRDHPDEVVIAEKQGLEVQFKRLSDIEHYQEIMGDSPLSEVWYSGVLGGVAVKP